MAMGQLVALTEPQRGTSTPQALSLQATRSEPYTHTHTHTQPKADSAGRNHPVALGAAPTCSRALPTPQGTQVCT